MNEVKLRQVEDKLDGKEVFNIEESLARQLHQDFRAACKAMKVPAGSHTHDHGFNDCGKNHKAYFVKRAQLLLKRAENKNPETLDQREKSFQALIVTQLKEEEE